MSDIDRKHGRGTILQHTVREAAGRSPDIETAFSLQRDFEFRERIAEFIAAASDKGQRLCDDDFVCVGDFLRGFHADKSVDRDISVRDECLCAAACLTESPCDNFRIQPPAHA